jgi:hypothetical protein
MQEKTRDGERLGQLDTPDVAIIPRKQYGRRRPMPPFPLPNQFPDRGSPHSSARALGSLQPLCRLTRQLCHRQPGVAA